MLNDIAKITQLVCRMDWKRERMEEGKICVFMVIGILRFIALHRYCVFYKLKVGGSPMLSKSIGAIFPTAFAYFVSLCHILVILEIF